MSELKSLFDKHSKEISELRARCEHKKKDIIIKMDSSVYPKIDVICTNCGVKKIIFGIKPNTKVKKTLKLQGFKDERKGTICWGYELERQKK